MKVKRIILMFHLLHLCSLYDSTTTKTTNALHQEMPDGEIPRIETSKTNTLTLPGMIGIIFVIIVIITTIAYCTTKKYCCRQSTSLDVSQTNSRECFSTDDPPYPVISYWTVYPAWAPPVYPTSAGDISQSDVFPPRYSSIFDDNGQEIVPANQ